MDARFFKIVLGAVMVVGALGGTDNFLGTWKVKRENSKESSPSRSGT